MKPTPGDALVKNDIKSLYEYGHSSNADGSIIISMSCISVRIATSLMRLRRVCNACHSIYGM